MKSWKDDEKTYKSNRIKEGLGLTSTIMSNIENKLSTLAKDNGWSCDRSEDSYEEGVKYILMPVDPRDEESYTHYQEMIDLIKEEFSNFTEDQFKVEFTPHVRWMLPIITVIFH